MFPKTYARQARILIFVFVLLFSGISSSRAAFPLKEQQQQQERVQQLYRKINEASAKRTTRALQADDPLPEGERATKEDSGVYGILALVFGVIGIFPAAIVLGIIGMEKHRKYRELAVIGLVLGILTLVALLLLIGFIFILFGTFL